MRTLEQLINLDEPGWPIVQEWISQASTSVEVLPAAPTAGESLVSLQVTTRSPMGAVIYHTGGLLVDHGWLRILGSGHERLPRSLSEWNFACGMKEGSTPPPCLLIADDAVGGFFALNGGRFGEGHSVWYFAPDTLEWEDLGLGYSAFLQWSFSDAIVQFYEPFRWPNWQKEVAALGGSNVLFIYPPLSASGPDLIDRHRGSVPVSESFSLHVGEL